MMNNFLMIPLPLRRCLLVNLTVNLTYFAESVFAAAGKYRVCPDHNLPTVQIIDVAIPSAQAEYGELFCFA